MSHGFPLLHDYLAESAARLPRKVALVAGERRLTYADLLSQSNALALALVEQGVERGDRVVVLCENGPEAVIAFWAALAANAVAVPVHPQTRHDKLAYYLQDSRATALVTQAHLAPVFARAAPRSSHLVAVVVAGELDAERHPELRSVTPWEVAVGRGQPAAPERRAIDIDLAAVIYTSGSTGDPKGVMLTHRNMLAAAQSITTYLENVEEDVILSALPLSFDYGLYQMIMAAKVGARLVLEKSFAYPAQILARVIEEGVTGFPGVPTMFAILSDMKTIGEHDFSRIRYVTNTAAALPVKHIQRLAEIFPTAKIFSMYGLTECKRCTYLPPADLRRKPTSVGIPIPNTEAWIVDEGGRRVPPNTVGQLVIRGATVMKGYWEKPEATAEKLRPGPLPGEQVLYTGDYCTMDDEGYVYFVGRMDDIIKSRGEKVAPSEIEHALMAVRGVLEAAVIGVDDELLGQAPKAFVVLEDGAELDEKMLRRECQARLESFMVPKYIHVTASLPRSGNGKIDKRALA